MDTTAAVAIDRKTNSSLLILRKQPFVLINVTQAALRFNQTLNLSGKYDAGTMHTC